MNRTKIEYLDYTFNPIAMRCTPVSEGCANCWHLRMANRLHGAFITKVPIMVGDKIEKTPGKNFRKSEAYSGGRPYIDTYELSAPLRLRKPARIGVQFMGDLFHDNISIIDIAKVIKIIRQCPKHTFFILTKRARRLYDTLREWDIASNVWLGVSVENQKAADERIPWLLKTPAAKRFVSCEPMLGPLNFHIDAEMAGDPQWQFINALTGKHDDMGRPCPDVPRLDWVIAGAETGPGSRPAQIDWFRSIRYQCAAAGVPFFLKQVNSSGDRELDGRMHEETL